MKHDQLKLGSLLSYGQMLLSILIGVVYTPVMIRLLGQSEYGLYNTVASTIAMLTVLSLGFSSSYVRFFSQYKLQNNEDAISRLNGLFLIIFTIIGTVVLCCGLFLSFNLRLVFDRGLTDSEYQTARILMLLLSFSLSISFPMSVFSSIISAHEQFVILRLLGIMKTVVGPLVTLPLLLMGKGSIAMVSVTVAISLLTDLSYFIFVRRKLHCRFVFRDFDKGLFKSLLVFTSFIAINMIVDQINNNLDKFLLGRFHGTTSVAVYSVSFTLYNYYMMFSSSVSGVFAPRVHRLVQSTRENLSLQRQQLTELFTKVGRVQFAILGLIASGMVFFGKPFIAFWAGPEYGESYYVALLLILPASIALIQNIGIEIQRAQNTHKFRSIVYIFMALLNLVATIFLCQLYGPIGAAIGTAFSLLIANGLIMNIYYHKRCNINILSFWKAILRMALGILPAIACGVGLHLWLDMSTFINMALGIVLYTLVYCAGMWLLGLNNWEKDLIKKPLHKLLGKGV